MAGTTDGSGRRRGNRGPADPEQRGPRSRGRLAAIVVGVILVVLVIWLVIYFVASESADADGGASGFGTGTVMTAEAMTEQPRTSLHVASLGR